MGALKPVKVKREVEEEERQVNGEENQPLSPMAQLFHRPECNVYIIVMVGFKKKVDPEIFKANLADTLPKQPRFSSLQVMDKANGSLKWVRTEINLDRHVIVPKLDQNIIASPDNFVEDYIYSLSKTTINMSMPMWDAHILNLKTTDAESVCVIRIHHSLGDGNSLVSLLLACTRRVSDPDKLPTVPSNNRFSFSYSPSNGGFWPLFLRFCFAILMIWNTIVDVTKFIATAMALLKDSETPIKPARVIESTPRRFVRRTVSLNDIKLVKNATNATINDVILGVIESGLSRYLNGKYGEIKPVDRISERDDNLPRNIYLRTTVFMNIRPSSGIHELADMMKKGSKARWGNHIGYVLLPNNITLRDDPLEYVREAKVKMNKKKASLEASFSFYLAKYSLKYFGDKMASFPSQTTLWYSNIQGPLEEISYYGLPVSYICGSCYGLPTALLIHVVSYADKMSIVLSVDDTIIPDHHKLCDDFEASLNLMKSAAIGKGNSA